MKNYGENMKQVIFYLQPSQIKYLNKIVTSGIVPNRSELIRRIIDKYLFDYYKMIKTFEILTPEQIKTIGE